MTAELKRRLIPVYVIAAVLSLPLLQHAWRLHQIDQNSKAAAVELASPSTKPVQGTPSRILVPEAGIDLPVVPGSQNQSTKIWSVSSKDANYATNTAPANNTEGQTLIYGHNNHKVFGSLLGLKPGAAAYVYTQNGHVFEYKYKASRDLTPNRSDLFHELETGKGLVLMTCDGPKFEYRHVMSFELLRAS
jgi:LPXTG-site transpeptidase (sortase) family protein